MNMHESLKSFKTGSEFEKKFETFSAKYAV